MVLFIDYDSYMSLFAVCCEENVATRFVQVSRLFVFIIPKEVAVVGLDNCYVAHWIVTLSMPIVTVSRSVRIENN